MRVLRLNDHCDRDAFLQKVGSTKAGNVIMREKMRTHLFYIQDLRTPAANILKQDALSIGADLAVEKDTILCKSETVDAVLMGTEKQLKVLSQKEKAQPFGLKALAKSLESHLSTPSYKTKVMAVLNTNDDSFYASSRFSGENACKQVEALIEEGADIIDLGGVSSRPGSEPVSAQEELSRVQPVIEAIYRQKLYEKVRFSLDSYAPLVIQYALDHGFDIVNDITGLANDEVAKLASRYGAEVVIMHMLGDPQTMQDNPTYENVITDVDSFFEARIQKAKSFGIERIVLDVGIGFGKRLEDNLALIQHLGHFRHFGYELLIGASRKSMIDKLYTASPYERLPGTLALHLKAVEEGASIVRCHDVKEHVQALAVQRALQGVTL